MTFVPKIFRILKDLIGAVNRQPSKKIPVEPSILEFYSSMIQEGDVCYDIGANMGSKTDIFLSLGASVVCVEPQPECVKELKRKYRFHKIVTIVAQGLSDEEGVQSLALCAQAPTIATFSDRWRTGRFRDYHWDETITIPMTTLDLLIERLGPPHFCKIDVEGYELLVLRGLSYPVPIISFEFTKEFKCDIKPITEHLMSIGPYEFNYCLGEEPGFKLPSWTDPPALIESLSSIDDPLLWGDIYARIRINHAGSE